MRSRRTILHARRLLVCLALGSLLGGLVVSAAAQARSRVIKIGTAAPRGTPWAKAASEMAQAIETLSDGKLRVKVYAGVVGDEPTILRKLRVGQLQGAVLTSTGLSLIAREPMVLQMPMVFASYAELDAVRDAMAPELAAIFRSQGFELLTWGDAGWLYFFTKKPAQSLEDVAGLKTWIWAHDEHGIQAFKRIGFVPVVLSSVDLVPSLQTGLIEAFPAAPMVALSLQTHTLAPHMIDVPWAPVVGATILATEAWELIPVELQPQVHQACEEIGARLRSQVRAETEQAVAAMQKHGLKVHRPTPEQLEAWRAKALTIRSHARGKALDAALVDKVIRLRDQVRADQQKKAMEK